MYIRIDAISSAPALKITKRDCVVVVRKGESFLYSNSGDYTSRWPEVHQVVAQRRRKGVGIQDTSSCVGPLGVVVVRNDSQGGWLPAVYIQEEKRKHSAHCFHGCPM